MSGPHRRDWPPPLEVLLRWFYKQPGHRGTCHGLAGYWRSPHCYADAQIRFAIGAGLLRARAERCHDRLGRPYMRFFYELTPEGELEAKECLELLPKLRKAQQEKQRAAVQRQVQRQVARLLLAAFKEAGKGA